MTYNYSDSTDSNLTALLSLNKTTVLINETVTETSDIYKITFEIAKWINAMIIILGLITNTLILIILSRKKIGSQTTRIILIFLAATDLTVMFVEFFIHFVPYFWKWFQVFSTDLSCGFAFMIQGAVITTSSWYIMLMTIERFTVVWFPMKAKIICTQRKILVTCILIPIACLIIYSFFLIDIESQISDTGYVHCVPVARNDGKGSKALAFKGKIQIWITLYFFIPAITIVILNTGIVIRLAQAQRMQHKLSSKNSLKKARQNSVKLRPSGQNGVSRKISRQASQSSASNSIRKATTLVIAASVTFVVLMIPRGVSTTLTLDASWKYDGDTEFILDVFAYQLQYLNHAINFFLYVLANNSFRRELRNLGTCSRSTSLPSQANRKPLSYADTDATQTSPIRRSERDAADHVKLTLKYCLDTLKEESGEARPVEV